jgi:UDP-2-acetamido-3-amino-2,3-dideoxy-glucuronate N-acetyltransferase
LRVGVVGAGRWGQNLVRVFSALPEVELAAVCDVVAPPPVALGKAEFHGDFESFLRGSRLDAVVIATPAELHATQTIAALECGHHVFVEKPMALSLRDACRMREAARGARRILMVGHLLRYHPAVVRMKQLVTSGSIGRIEKIVALRLSPGAPDAALNPWWSLAPHDLSLLRYLTATEFVEVSARHGTLGGALLVRARVRSSGVAADIIVGASHPAKVRRLLVFGSERTACFDDGDPGPSLRLHEGRLVPSDGLIAEFTARSWVAATTWEAVQLPRVEPLAAEATHFVTAALHGGRVATDADEGCRVIAALEAGSQSMSRNGEWVPVLGTPQVDAPAQATA